MLGEVEMVSIVLPVRNQGDHIAQVVVEHNELLKRSIPTRFELILVVNACIDDTASICRKLAADIDSVRLVESDIPGWGAAVKLGINSAVGELICIASSARDRSWILRDSIAFALSTPGSVIQARRSARWNFIRRLGSTLYNWQCRTLFGLSIGDINGTPKVFPRSFKQLMTLKEDGFLIDLEFDVACQESGYPVIELPVPLTTRYGGKSMTTIWAAIYLGFEAFKYRFTRRPNVDRILEPLGE